MTMHREVQCKRLGFRPIDLIQVLSWWARSSYGGYQSDRPGKIVAKDPVLLVEMLSDPA